MTEAESLKITIIGDAGVGKSSLFLRFVDDYFSEMYLTTIVVDTKTKTLEVDGRQVKLEIFDLCGAERYRYMQPSYFESAQGYIVVFDVADAESFAHLKYWFAEIDRLGKPVPKLIVGNKSDLTRVVDANEAAAFASGNGATYIEASVKSGNVDVVFHTIVKQILASKQ
eukprot:TRINITY_DN1656_c0_g1_i1.p1 TRINITY_DN1656_c0_g1~~TRINITY_DN1656_c0_g1_i1.p1  ORF type:complete len:169 (-),score=48.03 TRINITY_DN1656_c0_g1_i1:77-583(-)